MKLDGADTALPHIVTEGLDRAARRLARRGRLAPDEERKGTIRDIAGFRLVD